MFSSQGLSMEKATRDSWFSPTAIFSLVAILVAVLWGMTHMYKAYNFLLRRIGWYLSLGTEGTSVHKIYINVRTEAGHSWKWRKFLDPASFRTIAMEDKEKSMLQTDLEYFLDIGNYTEMGKIWKKKFFIYGLPGTGKTTLVCCIAKQTKLDTYIFRPKDLEENIIQELLKAVKSRCIVVFENFDNFLYMHENARKEEGKFSLVALMNIIDTCWCKSQGPNIIIFTSRNDHSLLMKEHVDIMINLGLCSFEQFKFLAQLFKGLPESFEEFGPIEDMLKHTRVSPAIICKLLKKQPTDISPEGFVGRIIRALEKFSSF